MTDAAAHDAPQSTSATAAASADRARSVDQPRLRPANARPAGAFFFLTRKLKRKSPRRQEALRSASPDWSQQTKGDPAMKKTLDALVASTALTAAIADARLERRLHVPADAGSRARPSARAGLGENGWTVRDRSHIDDGCTTIDGPTTAIGREIDGQASIRRRCDDDDDGRRR